MNYCKGRIGRLQTGSDGAFTHMNTGILNDLKFPYPPIELQQEFAEKITLIEQQKELAKQELKESEDLFNCLLQKRLRENWYKNLWIDISTYSKHSAKICPTKTLKTI